MEAEIARSVSTTSPTTVLVCDDHKMVAEMIVKTLAAERDISVLASVGTTSEAIAFVDEHHPDVVLMDYRLPDGNGIDAARRICTSHPWTRVVMVTGEDNDQLLSEALRAGCAGYLNKSEGVATLAAAVRGAHAGATAMSPDMLAHIMTSARNAGDREGLSKLSAQELEVLKLVSQGSPDIDIAKHLDITLDTVRENILSVLEKLNANSKMEAVTTAIHTRLVKPPRPEAPALTPQQRDQLRDVVGRWAATHQNPDKAMRDMPIGDEYFTPRSLAQSLQGWDEQAVFFEHAVRYVLDIVPFEDYLASWQQRPNE